MMKTNSSTAKLIAILQFIVEKLKMYQFDLELFTKFFQSLDNFQNT